MCLGTVKLGYNESDDNEFSHFGLLGVSLHRTVQASSPQTILYLHFHRQGLADHDDAQAIPFFSVGTGGLIPSERAVPRPQSH